MAVVRKVQSRVKIVKSTAPIKEAMVNVDSTEEGKEGISLTRTKKVCSFCEKKDRPRYFDAQALRRFMNDRGKITGRQRSGVCSKHQRLVSREIKRARHLSLLPFVASI